MHGHLPTGKPSWHLQHIVTMSYHRPIWVFVQHLWVMRSGANTLVSQCEFITLRELATLKGIILGSTWSRSPGLNGFPWSMRLHRVLYLGFSTWFSPWQAHVLQLLTRFRTVAFPMPNSSTPIPKQWQIFIDNVLPKCSDFDTFRQRVSYINLDTQSSKSPSNGGASHLIYLKQFS